MPAHNERVILDLETENHVIRGARLRIRDGEVIAYELACVPIDLLPETDGTSAFVDIHALAAANLLALGEATERLSQVAADRIIAKHPALHAGAPSTCSTALSVELRRAH